jgi:hypothetical protein
MRQLTGVDVQLDRRALDGGMVAAGGIAGNITGTVDATSFTGTITLSINQTAGCSGSFSGSAATASTTLTWSSAGFTGNCNLNAGNPLSPRFVLQRR